MNKKILSVLAFPTLLVGLVGCNDNVSTAKPSSSEPSSTGDATTYTPDLKDKVSLKLSVNYNKDNGMKYTQDTAYVTPKGTEIKAGDFKPVYQALQNKLNFTIDDVTPSANKAVDYFKTNWKTSQYADLACGNVSDIVDFSVQGTSETILDISKYLDYMPNFKNFLDENPIVKKSITTAKHSDATDTGIYYLPYFDGFADLEKMTMLRADYVRKILDSTDTVWDETTGKIAKSSYASTIGNGARSLVVPVAIDSTETKTITKNATKNIITRQNELINAGTATAKKLVAQFKEYMADRYGAQYAKLSDLFLGVDASYDADEMIALMRIVRCAPQALTGNAAVEMVPFVPREYNNQRIADLYRWAGQLWGVRGVESRCGYLYIDKDGKIQDARGDSQIADLLENLNSLYKEGLILKEFENKSGYGVTNGKYAEAIVVGGNAKYSGFMEYDYAQTQGAWNDKASSKAVEGYELRPITGAAAEWTDSSSSKYMQFTESWRSVKTQAWCLSAGLKSNDAKLKRALALADFFYSNEGHNLNSYGPESENYTSGTINYQGREVPKFTDAALEQLNDTNIGSGSYTNYLRKYVGATLPIGYVKEQGMEYQCTSENAKNGLAIINKGLELGTFKHVECAETENPFYSIVPSAFALSSDQVALKTNLENSAKLGSMNSNNSTSSYCIWDNYVMYGFGGTKGDKTLETRAQYLTMINTTFELPKLVKAYNDAYELM